MQTDALGAMQRQERQLLDRVERPDEEGAFVPDPRRSGRRRAAGGSPPPPSIPAREALTKLLFKAF